MELPQNQVIAQSNHAQVLPETEPMRKLFVGGLAYKTTADSIKEYFSIWGQVVNAVVMRDQATNRPKGFGFVTFARAKSVDDAQHARPHEIDRKMVQTKRVYPRQDSGRREVCATVNRLFVGCLDDNIQENDLQNYFGKYGYVCSIKIMLDQETGRRRGFAFVDFNDYDPVDKICMEKFHMIKGKRVNVEKAVRKEPGGARVAGGGRVAGGLSRGVDAVVDPFENIGGCYRQSDGGGPVRCSGGGYGSGCSRSSPYPRGGGYSCTCHSCQCHVSVCHGCSGCGCQRHGCGRHH